MTIPEPVIGKTQASPIPRFIRRLMPEASDPELADAAERIRQYIALVLRIRARLEREGEPVDSLESRS